MLRTRITFLALLPLVMLCAVNVWAEEELDASKIDVNQVMEEGEILEAEYLDPQQPLPDSPSQALKFSVPEGTKFDVELNSEMDSHETLPGDRFSVVLKTPLLSPMGYAVLPTGSRLTGEVKDVFQARTPRIEAKVRIVFYEAVTPDEEIIPLEAAVDTEDGYLVGNRRVESPRAVAVSTAIQQTVAMTAGPIAGAGAGAAMFVLGKKGKAVMFRAGDEISLKLNKAIVYNPNPIFRSVAGNEHYNFLNIAPEEVPVQFPRLILDSSVQ